MKPTVSVYLSGYLQTKNGKKCDSLKTSMISTGLEIIA